MHLQDTLQSYYQDLLQVKMEQNTRSRKTENAISHLPHSIT